jgi:glycosyltransferase involved in cell wall biosynthesis
MRVALLRGSLLRAWELPNYVIDGVDVTAFASRRVAASLHDAPIAVRGLPSTGEAMARLSPRISGAIELLAGNVERMAGVTSALHGFDIAHALEVHNPLTLQAIRARRAGSVQRVVATVMENIAFVRPPNRLVARRIEETARATDLFIAITERARLHLQTSGVPSERIVVQPLGIDMEHFRPEAGEREPGPLRVLTVARLEPAKGVEDLVVAAGLLEQRRIAIEVSLLGQGPMRDRLADIAAELGIADRVHFHGQVPWEAMPRFYRRHDAFVLASAPTRNWREQFGFAIVEAMACGLPVLVGGSGSIPEVVGREDGLVRPHDPMDLADRLAALHADPVRRAELGAWNRARAVECYDQRRVAVRLGEIYQQALELPPLD